MKHLFLTYELSMIAKEKGFNENCVAKYDKEQVLSYFENPEAFYTINSKVYWFTVPFASKKTKSKTCTAPTHQQIVDWFIKKEIFINWEIEVADVFEYYGTIHLVRDYNKVLHFKSDKQSDNYKALNKAIEEALKLI